jgi:succinyl-CoA synthetase beta subunit/citryl-CoA synthetase large subunit
MKALEFEAKALLAASGLIVPGGGIATTPDEADEVARGIGRPVVVKAHIPIGGRMRAGGVRFARTPEEAASIAGDMLGRELLGHAVPAVLVEERLDGADEIFVSVAYDGRARRAVLLASRAGGVDVEGSDVVHRTLSLSAANAAPDYLGREVAAEIGYGGSTLLRLGAVITSLVSRFVEWDALLLELNPLILRTDGEWCVADVHLELDDDAAFRQQAVLARLPHSLRAARMSSDFERRAAEIDGADHRGVAGRLVRFDGDLGLLIGGGGASLTIMDAILDAGLKPANYCEIGGNPSVWKVKELTKLILGQPGVNRMAVVMNVVSNTRADLVARGVIKGVLEMGRDPREVIAAFRIPGSWELESQAILSRYGVAFFDRDADLDRVVEAIRCRS